MMKVVILLALLACAAALMMPTASKIKAGARTVLDTPLPVLYVYDHCPFCVRVRFAFGAKNFKFDTRFMANDDIPTPTELVGKKIAPIFEDKERDICMAESMDIVKLADADERYGATGTFKPATDRDDIKAWMKTVKARNSMMQRPRYMMSYLPEFATQDGKDAFVKNHPIGDVPKPDWRDDSKFTYDQRWSRYVDSYKESLTKVDEVSASLKELDDLIYCADYCTEGGLSYDDIDLWSRLRSLTIIKGVDWPAKTWQYMTNLSELGDVPLLDTMQC